MKTQNDVNSSELKEFFTNHLKTVYWAEKKLADTLPDMEEAATSQDLKTAFNNHLAQTNEHVSRLEQVFSIIGEEADADKCKIMESITDAGSKTISKTEDGSNLRDIGLIYIGQLAEHYEIACYGNLIEMANTLGYSDAADIMEQTLAEEKEADATLTQVAQSVNDNVGTEV